MFLKISLNVAVNPTEICVWNIQCYYTNTPFPPRQFQGWSEPDVEPVLRVLTAKEPTVEPRKLVPEGAPTLGIRS